MAGRCCEVELLTHVLVLPVPSLDKVLSLLIALEHLSLRYTPFSDVSSDRPELVTRSKLSRIFLLTPFESRVPCLSLFFLLSLYFFFFPFKIFSSSVKLTSLLSSVSPIRPSSRDLLSLSSSEEMLTVSYER